MGYTHIYGPNVEDRSFNSPLYDELYELLLFCVLIKDNKARKDKFSNFLKSVHGGM